MENKEKRLSELAVRADERCYVTFSDFLNLEEESILAGLKLNTPYYLYGGYDMAERCIAAFGEGCESAAFPISIVKIEPASQKFADRLSHRDFLGSLMGLGIKREVLGDIVIGNNTGWLFCLNTIAEYIVKNLDKVRHTSVKCSIADQLPDTAVSKPEEKELTAASERLDVITAAVYNLSRNAVKELFTSRRVYVNSRFCENFSFIPKKGDIISVRGYGRFIYCGVIRTTKKNRLIILAKIYK